MRCSADMGIACCISDSFVLHSLLWNRFSLANRKPGTEAGLHGVEGPGSGVRLMGRAPCRSPGPVFMSRADHWWHAGFSWAWLLHVAMSWGATSLDPSLRVLAAGSVS